MGQSITYCKSSMWPLIYVFFSLNYAIEYISVHDIKWSYYKYIYIYIYDIDQIFVAFGFGWRWPIMEY